jgi:hypothetical protein
VYQVKQVAESFSLPYVDRAFDGDIEAAKYLVTSLGNNKRGFVAVAMWLAKVERPAFRSFLSAVWEHDHAHLIAAANTRRLTAMFRYADFPLPPHLPEVVRVWRGTHGITLRDAAQGFSWTVDRDIACWFASRYKGRTAQVITANIPREQIAYFSNDRGEQEVVLMKPPKSVCVDGNIEDWRVGHARHGERIRKLNTDSSMTYAKNKANQ